MHRQRHRLRVLALGTLVGVGWLLPTDARAGTVNYIPPPADEESPDCVQDPGRLVYVAGGGEKNRVTVTGVSASVTLDLGLWEGPCAGYAEFGAGTMLLHDGLADVASIGCKKINRHSARCPWPGFLEIQLGDQDDELFLSLAARFSDYVSNVPRAGGQSAAVHAGSGNDTLRVLNGTKDYVICGTGFDTVLADRNDALAECERVDRA